MAKKVVFKCDVCKKEVEELWFFLYNCPKGKEDKEYCEECFQKVKSEIEAKRK